MVEQSTRFTVSLSLDSEGVMSLTLVGKGKTGRVSVETLYKKIAPGASCINGWLDVHDQFEIRFHQKQAFLEVREKNNPPGPYGQATVLAIFPAFLHELELISTEEMVVLLDNIKKGARALKR